MRALAYTVSAVMLFTGCVTATQGTASPVPPDSMPAEDQTQTTEDPPQAAAEESTPTDQPTSEPVGVGLELIAEGFVSPVVLTHANDGSGRLFIADLIGLVHVVSPEGELLDTPFLDLREHMLPLQDRYEERGLLGM